MSLDTMIKVTFTALPFISAGVNIPFLPNAWNMVSFCFCLCAGVFCLYLNFMV